MPSEQTDKIEAIAERLRPSAPFYRHQRLFTERDFDLYEEKGNYEEQSAELESRRQMALKEIATSGGTQAVLDFANIVQSPWRVGIAFGVVADEDVEGLVLPSLLATDQKSCAQFVSGFVWSRFHAAGWSWVDRINTSQWYPTQVAQFLSILPFMKETWARAACLLENNESLYWEKASANAYEADTGLDRALEKFIEYGRPFAAIRCIYRMVQRKHPFDRGKAVQALLAALRSKESPHATDSHEIIEIIKALQKDPDTNTDDLFNVEWAYLPILGRLRDASPQLLSRQLATQPKFFCEVIRLVFRSKGEPKPVEQPTEEKRKIAANGYRLLNEWSIPPGMQADGSFNGDDFVTWLNKVKKECAETGHLEIAMTMLGHVLIHVPADDSGLWIQHSVAAALNARDAEDIRNGFWTELYNSRGAHYVDPTGKPERDLAEKYRAQAEALEQVGYHRFAATLRALAESYEREAEKVSSKERFDD
jgi:hypothetical protein